MLKGITSFIPTPILLKEFHHSSFLKKIAKASLLVDIQKEMPPKASFLLAVVVPALIPSKLEVKDSVVSCNPQGIMR